MSLYHYTAKFEAWEARDDDQAVAYLSQVPSWRKGQVSRETAVDLFLTPYSKILQRLVGSCAL